MSSGAEAEIKAKPQPAITSISVAATAICAALYAVFSFATAYIESPWGMGQFRPAVVIPAVFAVVFGPLPAGLGAAVGTLICDSIKHGCLYIPSLTAAVPGNFIGFYFLGYFLKGRFSWRRFIVLSSAMLLFANAMVAVLYLLTKCALGVLVLTPGQIAVLSVGLTLWWFATMLPFMLFLTPPLIEAVARAAPSVVPADVREASIAKEDKKLFILALVVPGLAFVSLGLLLAFTPLGAIAFPGKLSLGLEPTKIFLVASGGGLLLLGLLFGAWVKLSAES